MDANKLAEIETSKDMPNSVAALRKPFGRDWSEAYFTKWATIVHAFRALGVEEGQTILDVGVGTGWTTVFLAEDGYRPTGIDLAPTSAEVGAIRAKRYGVKAAFQTADMDDMQLDQPFDACLVFDALHHSMYQSVVVQRISAHLKPGGWVLFGEPSWLHRISPHAIKTSRDRGWVERGVRVRVLKRDCVAAGLGCFRRFYEGSAPTHRRGGLAWQVCRLVLAPLASSPQTSIWLAAQKSHQEGRSEPQTQAP